MPALEFAPGPHPAFDRDDLVVRRFAGEDGADVEFVLFIGRELS